MAYGEVAGVDPRCVLYDRRHDDVYEAWLERLGDPDAAEDAAQWALLSAAEGLEDDQVRELVQAALPDLSVAARTALLLRDREGLSYAEVAERLAVAPSTAARIVYIARLRLVEALRRVRQALNLAPLLGWFKSVAAGLTAAKGIAATAALGAAAGLSVIAMPAHESKPADPAPQPVQPTATRALPTHPAQIQPGQPAARIHSDATRVGPVTNRGGAPPAAAPPRPQAPAERTSEPARSGPASAATPVDADAALGTVVEASGDVVSSGDLISDVSSSLSAELPVETPALPAAPKVPAPPGIEPALPVVP